MMNEFQFTAPLWEWPAKAAWFFVTLPVDVAGEIRLITSDEMMPKRGFGSARVEVRVGGSVWATSVFPDKQSGSYVLPIKAAVRKAEGLDKHDDVTVLLRLIGI